MESFSDSIGQWGVTCCTDLKNTQTTIRAISMHQCREAFRKTSITFAQLLTDQLALSLTQEWKLSTTVQNVRDCFISWLVTFTQVYIVWWMHVTQETPGTHSLWGQFVIVFVMKAPKADRRVA